MQCGVPRAGGSENAGLVALWQQWQQWQQSRFGVDRVREHRLIVEGSEGGGNTGEEAGHRGVKAEFGAFEGEAVLILDDDPGVLGRALLSFVDDSLSDLTVGLTGEGLELGGNRLPLTRPAFGITRLSLFPAPGVRV